MLTAFGGTLFELLGQSKSNARTCPSWAHPTDTACFSSERFPQRRVQLRCGVLLHSGEHVAVCVERDCAGRVAEAFADYLRMNALAQQLGRVCMSEIVEADHRQI